MEDKNLFDEQLFLRVPQVAKLLGLGKATVYTLLHNGTIPYKKIGKNILVPRSYIDSLINEFNQQLEAK